MPIIELLFTLFCGLVFGSFITLASYRLPREEDIVVKPSRCPKCDTRLGFKDLWPVLSWATSGGKCRHCRTPVSIRYPLTELFTAALFLLIYARYGITMQGILLALMAVALIIMIIADIEEYIIPDEVHLALLPLGLGYHAILGTPPESVLWGFLFGMGLGLLLHHGYRWLRKKEGLGYGDVKFLAVAGLWLGVYGMVPFMFFSGIFGVIFGLIWRLLGNGKLFPFGPALAAALFLGVAFPESGNYFWHLLHH
ncbi:MAG: prepilin peptidase [Pseudomonadota bacterium]|nr:prepilin peptidase [Pseudomonadota bacterium]